MNSKMVYGGMATAMVAVLAVGFTLHFATDYNGAKRLGDVASLGEDVQEEKTAPMSRPEPAELRANATQSSPPATPPPIAKVLRPETLALKRSPTAERDRTVSGMVRQQSASGELAPAPAASSAPTAAFRIAESEPMPPRVYQDTGRDRFENVTDNPVKLVSENPISTFSIDVDTASYSFVRRQLSQGVLPQKDAVRIEEMINYFDYDYPLPESRDMPFRPTVAVTASPWAEGRKLVHIGIKGFDMAPAEKPRSNLVFLLDVSGSMNSPDKLPLLKTSMRMLVDTLAPEDTIAIVVYAGAAGTVLEPTAVKDKAKILQALDRLSAGGSTAGAEGIRQAYQLAEASFDKDAVNRVILATDGDFNVGITSSEELKDFVERKRDTGIYLSVLGFGQGNLNDRMMQALAQNGNGVAAYIDTLSEARKVLVEEAGGTLFTIAKDVKIQVEFNPATVAEYRLIGYETRALNREDFRNDAVDAGDIGAGHTVTAIYEITPTDGPRLVAERRYAPTAEQQKTPPLDGEFAFLKIRYKLPDEDTSRLFTQPIGAANETFSDTIRRETNWATSVAAFGQILKGGRYTGAFGYDDVIALAQANKGGDPFGYRTEFVQLVRLAKSAAPMRAN